MASHSLTNAAITSSLKAVKPALSPTSRRKESTFTPFSLTAPATSRTQSSWLLNVAMESTPRSASATAVVPTPAAIRVG
jgi:hypothetical protein